MNSYESIWTVFECLFYLEFHQVCSSIGPNLDTVLLYFEIHFKIFFKVSTFYDDSIHTPTTIRNTFLQYCQYSTKEMFHVYYMQSDVHNKFDDSTTLYLLVELQLRIHLFWFSKLKDWYISILKLMLQIYKSSFNVVV